MELYFYNSLSSKKEIFKPINDIIRMYVCGPTVYDIPHIGNARSLVIYDLLYRLLIHKYGASQVVYVRNLTDVDDKINKAAKDQDISINELTEKITINFHDICNQLNCLAPNIEPKATEHIDSMINMIKKLIANDNAYISNGHVYFKVESFANYGKLCGRSLTDMFAGARIEISENKKYSGDFVLWKPASINDDASSIWQSPWGDGRPGWHIECSAMSGQYLGNHFDIHGGGIDLIFPHHTNEIAQSCAANKSDKFTNYWIHNGFLTVDGEKMSKSLGNFLTVKDIADKGFDGDVIRYMLLSSYYRKPLDFKDKLINDSKKSLMYFYKLVSNDNDNDNDNDNEIDLDILTYLHDDLNTPKIFAKLHALAKDIESSNIDDINYRKKQILRNSLKFLGFKPNYNKLEQLISDEEVEIMILERSKAKDNRNWKLADEIRDKLHANNIILEDNLNGKTCWKIKI